MNTPFAYAAYNEHIDAMKLLLEHGADLTIENEYGWSLYKQLISRKIGMMVKLDDRHHVFNIRTNSDAIDLLLSLKNPKTDEPYYIGIRRYGLVIDVII